MNYFCYRKIFNVKVNTVGGGLNKVSNIDIGGLMMRLSPKKYVTNFTSSTTNRGVEAKEKEITNTRLGRQRKFNELIRRLVYSSKEFMRSHIYT